MPTRIDPAAHPALENYIQFLRFFRGTVDERDDAVEIDSDRDDFTMMIPLHADAAGALARARGSILSLPWIEGLDESLARLERRRSAEIVFMSKPTAAGAGGDAAGVRAARSAPDLEEFSLVQCRGFFEDEATLGEWFPWLRAANLRNGGNDACHFLIADLDGRPASVTLLVESARACGIYAVATPPEYRRRGLSTRLLRAGESIARRRGYGETCLQVYAGTYAHGLYDRLGFVEDYRVGVWR